MKERIIENAESISSMLENMSEAEILRLEDASTRINGNYLSDYQLLTIDKIKLKASFAYNDIEQLDFYEAMRVRKLLEHLEADIDNREEVEELRGITVILSLMLDVDVTYYTSFRRLLNDGIFERISDLDEIDYDQLKDLVTYGGRGNKK